MIERISYPVELKKWGKKMVEMKVIIYSYE